MTDKPTPTADLLKRCAEIHEWRSTGVLSGEALRDYSKRKWPGLLDTLRMAEHETVTEALALLAKWGTPPAVAGEPVAWLSPWRADQVTTDYDAYGEHGIPLYTTPQPAQPQAGAVPLTPEAINSMAREYPAEDLCGWCYRMGVADAEHHHGIKGGQHGTE